MKRLILTAAAFIALTAFTFTEKIWTNDPAHSQLVFTVTHMGISDVSGTFNDFHATIRTVKTDLSDASIKLTAKVASIDTRVEQRDLHLKSADFLDAEKFPEITFESTGLKPAGKNRYKLRGNLTLHGLTRPVTLDLLYIGTAQNPVNKKQSAGYKVTGTISRKAFKIGEQFPAPLLSDAITINADGEFQAN
ncbi:YceI family protein [Pedobacter sp. SYP-B3415]|uniref:YceI family protein n=1 Tax=Pedobacter sp. SYP-B3415 TaxID=2496641 RepID=UPI00101D1771|nr:YceI family protein [Pedobacter sp. SYP-B3415]